MFLFFNNKNQNFEKVKLKKNFVIFSPLLFPLKWGDGYRQFSFFNFSRKKFFLWIFKNYKIFTIIYTN